MIEGILHFIFKLIGESVISINSTPSTKRINQHLNELKKESWFINLYEQPHFQKLFLTNQRIRLFIGEKKPKKLNENLKQQEKLEQMLREEILFHPSK